MSLTFSAVKYSLQASFVHLEQRGGERGGNIEARREALQTRGEAESPRRKTREARGTVDQAGDTGCLAGLGLSVQLHQSGNVWPLASCSCSTCS